MLASELKVGAEYCCVDNSVLPIEIIMKMTQTMKYKCTLAFFVKKRDLM